MPGNENWNGEREQSLMCSPLCLLMEGQLHSAGEVQLPPHSVPGSGGLQRPLFSQRSGQKRTFVGHFCVMDGCGSLLSSRLVQGPTRWEYR